VCAGELQMFHDPGGPATAPRLALSSDSTMSRSALGEAADPQRCRTPDARFPPRARVSGPAPPPDSECSQRDRRCSGAHGVPPRCEGCHSRSAPAQPLAPPTPSDPSWSARRDCRSSKRRFPISAGWYAAHRPRCYLVSSALARRHDAEHPVRGARSSGARSPVEALGVCLMPSCTWWKRPGTRWCEADLRVVGGRRRLIDRLCRTSSVVRPYGVSLVLQRAGEAPHHIIRRIGFLTGRSEVVQDYPVVECGAGLGHNRRNRARWRSGLPDVLAGEAGRGRPAGCAWSRSNVGRPGMTRPTRRQQDRKKAPG